MPCTKKDIFYKPPKYTHTQFAKNKKLTRIQQGMNFKKKIRHDRKSLKANKEGHP